MCQGYCRSRDSDIQPHGSRNVLDPRNEHNVAGEVSQRCFKMSQRPQKFVQQVEGQSKALKNQCGAQ
jgi:hypothetical protein